MAIGLSVGLRLRDNGELDGDFEMSGDTIVNIIAVVALLILAIIFVSMEYNVLDHSEPDD